MAPWLRRADRHPLRAGRCAGSIEDSLILAMAGPAANGVEQIPLICSGKAALSGRPTAAEQHRLRHVRERQGGTSLEAALDGLREGSGPSDSARGQGRTSPTPTRSLAESLTSILYAAYLGEPDGPALTGGNVASRHDLALTPTILPRPIDAWRLPIEEYRSRGGWRVTGSLLGLDTALAGLSLRRLDATAMPTSRASAPTCARRRR